LIINSEPEARENLIKKIITLIEKPTGRESQQLLIKTLLEFLVDSGTTDENTIAQLSVRYGFSINIRVTKQEKSIEVVIPDIPDRPSKPDSVIVISKVTIEPSGHEKPLPLIVKLLEILVNKKKSSICQQPRRFWSLSIYPVLENCLYPLA